MLNSAPSRRRPPLTVQAAAVLLLASLVVVFVGLAASLWTDAHNARYFRGSQEFGPSAVRSTVVTEAMVLVLVLMLGVGLVAMAYFNLRGRRGARVATWIFCGLVSLVVFYGMVRQAGGLNDGRVGAAQGTAQLAGVLGILGFVFLVYVGVVVLLALPPSNRFFRPLPPAPAYRPAAPYQGQPQSDHQGQVQPGYLGRPTGWGQYPPQQHAGWGQPPQPPYQN